MDVAGQLQPLLMGAQGERLHRVAQAFAEVEPLPLQHELPRLDLGEVEDVVDDREQGLARIADGGEVLALLGAELALEDQFGHADDGVQRRADFVAHVGQESALGAAGGLGRLLRRAQAPRRLASAAVMSCEMPNVPTICPSSSSSGSFVEEAQVVRPSGQVSFSSLVDDALPCAEDFLLVGHRLQAMFVGEEVEVGLADRLVGIAQAE